jgi:hypothetical protein
MTNPVIRFPPDGLPLTVSLSCTNQDGCKPRMRLSGNEFQHRKKHFFRGYTVCNAISTVCKTWQVTVGGPLSKPERTVTPLALSTITCTKVCIMHSCCREIQLQPAGLEVEGTCVQFHFFYSLNHQLSDAVSGFINHHWSSKSASANVHN